MWFVCVAAPEDAIETFEPAGGAQIRYAFQWGCSPPQQSTMAGI
jgi:hypothetical protein